MSFTEADVNNAIEMGLRSCDLYGVAAEDILCRSHLRKFLMGALESLMSRSDNPPTALTPPVPHPIENIDSGQSFQKPDNDD